MQDAVKLCAWADGTIAIGDAWRMAPAADLLYHADAPWWEHHGGVPYFYGEKWIPHRLGQWSDAPRWRAAAERFGLRMVASAVRDGISFDPALIHEGFNSGFQALNLAALMGGPGTEIALLGFDMGGEHFFGEHPEPLRRNSPWDLFRSAFDAAAPQLWAAPILVVNWSRETSLTCFLRPNLDEVIR